MYAKLFARITESSLMEEEIPVRFTFVMLLAIADPTGLVVGTDIAIARRFNMPLAQFQECIKALGNPDPDSNSKEDDGRRVIPSEGERGYQIVNYVKYRDLKDEDERREYMRNYMRNRRGSKLPVNTCKLPLAKLTQAEVEEEEEAEADAKGGALRSNQTKTLEENVPQYTNPPPSPSPDNDLIEQIRLAYPGREDKQATIRAIKRAIIERRVDPRWLLERTKLYARVRCGVRRIQPNPATWFNGERYNLPPSDWTRGLDEELDAQEKIMKSLARPDGEWTDDERELWAATESRIRELKGALDLAKKAA